MARSNAPMDIISGVSGKSKNIPLRDLLLDESNPRFGDSINKFSGQQEVLDWIVQNFGVDDVINSLAINGYFEAEPLVVEENAAGKYIVKEGNRRLAACLILAQDARAKNHNQRRKSVEKFLSDSEWNTETGIPSICFKSSDAQRLVAYLGVRHIVSSQPWDSYAKAAWIAKIVQEGSLSIQQIADLTGDKSQTIAKLLEGYNFVGQLERKGLFSADASYRRGRGSNVLFPFSWVYTILQYATVRNWLDMTSYSTSTAPIPEIREKDAALLLSYMFGDKNTETSPKIEDSRKLGALAYSISIPQHREMLRTGLTLSQIEENTRPATDRLMSLLVEARQNLRDTTVILSEVKVNSDEARDLLDVVRTIRKSALSAFKSLEELASEDMDDEDNDR